MAMDDYARKMGLHHMEVAFGRLKGEGRKLQRVQQQDEKTPALAPAPPLTQ